MPHTAFSIYNASAGSGKTYTLVKEYLRLLLTANTDDAYRRILAITFTNKAVEEMKRRIVENLSDFAKDDTSDRGLELMKVIGTETGLSIATIRDKAKAIIKNIIHNYAAFDISTIDRFTHKVIRAFAHDLNLSVSFDVSLETDLLLQEAVDAIIAKAGDDPVLTSLLVDFSLDKTDNDKSWDVTRELFETGKLLVDENNRNELAQFENKSIEDFLFIKEKLKQTIDALEHESIQLANDMFALLDENGVDHKSFSGQYFTKHIGYIRDNELKPTHKKYFETDDIKVNKTAKDRAIIENLAPKLIGTLAAVYKNYEKKNFYTAFLKNITPLSLLNSIGQELKRIQEEQNVLSISEFNAIIHREIQNQPAPFIYERLGERYRHFFIDEFQDTSHMQWHNLVPLIDNALSGEDLHAGPGSLMLVGDPKQSIYRWRGGRAEQFIELGKDTFNPFSNPDKKTLLLGTNYRSFSEVIDFNNSFFTFLAGEFDQPDYAAMYAESAQLTNPKAGGYVNISFISPQERTDSSLQIAGNNISDNNANFVVDEQGTKILQRSPQEVQRGGGGLYSPEQGFTDRLGERIRAAEAQCQRPLTQFEREDIERQVAFDFAQENNLWISDIYKLGHRKLLGGNESTLVVNENEAVVYKSNNLFNSKNSIAQFFENIAGHNAVFPGNKYTFAGFTGFENKGRVPYIEPVVKQDYIPGAEQATPQEIDGLMHSLGFEKINNHTFSNEEYIVSDLHPRNVLKDTEGNLHVVDDIVVPNKKQTTQSLSARKAPLATTGGATDALDEEEVSKDDLYLEATLNTIYKVLAQGFNLKDIVLLTRKRQPGILLATYLTEKGIKILSSETLLIDSATEVKLILNLLRYLKSNDNREAKAHFLYFAAGTQTAIPTHNFIAAGMEQPDEEALEQWLGSHGIHISFKGCRKKSLYEAVESIIDAFIKDRANQSYVQYFLDLVLERDMRTQSGIADFLDYWDKNGQKFSIPSPEGENAVRIMTIHKSKGLEFPVVISPFAEEDYSRSRRDKLWLELDDTTFEFQKALIDSSKAVAEYGEKAAELYKTKEQEELLDNINILYVALTRAEEQLYIISNRNFTSRGELTNNMSSYFIKFLQHKNVFDNSVSEYAFGNVISKSKSEKLSPKPNVIQVVKERFNPRRVKIAQRESLMWGSAQAQAIEFGNVTHEVLSFVKTEHDIPLALMKAVEQGLITHSQTGQMENTLKQVVTNPDLAVFFEEGNAIYNEQSIIAPNTPNIKPDRVAIRHGQAYLLDYKTGAHKEAYEKQLNGYAFALKQMGLPVARKAIVYIGDVVEIVNF